MSHFFLRSFAVICCLFLAACVGSGTTPKNATVLTDLGDFTVLSIAPQPETGLVQPSLLYKNREISPAVDPMRTLDAGQKTQNFPLPGCQSVTVEMFTGGANCCFGEYILTTCPDGSYAAFIEPRDGGLGDPQKALRAYPIDDPAFMYYEPENQKGRNKLALNRVESPRVSRFLVFERGAWRTDKPGEFPAAYATLFAEVQKDKQTNKTARAISMAYYTLMAGEKDAAAARTLNRALPKSYAPLARTILADIKTAIAAFDPVRNLVVAK